MKRTILLIFLLSLVSIPVLVAGMGWFKDGTYEGEHLWIKVAVSVSEGNFSDIEILFHGNGGKKYEAMIEPLRDEMIEKQSTDVDAVTGATVSSIYLRKAVNKALREAAISESWFDRTFVTE